MDHVSAPDMNGLPLTDFAADAFTTGGDENHLIDDRQLAAGQISPLEMNDASTSSKAGPMQDGLKLIIASSLVFAASVTVALILTILFGPDPVAPHGAVTSMNTECSQLGVDVLKKGGSAVDAAIAAAVCCSVVEPQLSGIAGGGFMTIREHSKGETHAIDFRESAPASVTEDTYNSLTPNSSGAWVGVPGVMKGLAEAHNKFGKVAWKDLISPSVQMARDGFTVSSSLAQAVGAHPNPPSIFYHQGNPVVDGDELSLPRLADVLDKIAQNGAGVLYQGELAEEIIQTVNSNGGNMSLNDLANYKVVHSDPITTTFFEHVVEAPGSPSGGPIFLLLLNVIEQFSSEANVSQALYYHRWLEAVKFAYGLRDNLGEMDDEDVISKDLAAEIRNNISDSQTLPESSYGSRGRADTGTGATISVVGPKEDFVSLSMSLNDPFGSLLVTPSGIILNNALADFDLPTESEPNKSNLPAGGRRPLSTMSPAVVHTPGKSCALRLSIGAAGDQQIIAGEAGVLLQLLITKSSLSEALKSPRLYPDTSSSAVAYSGALDASIVQFLTSRGHNIPGRAGGITSFVGAALKANDSFQAATDLSQNGTDFSVVF